MNIRGILLDKVKIQLINKEINNISLQYIKSLDIFNSFNWNNFKKAEFSMILSALDNFLSNLTISKNQEFVLFYETDVTEMDSVTVLKKNDKLMLIDFEIKNGDDEEKLLESLYNQIKMRQENAMPQLFKDSNYLIVGIINNKHKLTCYFNEGNTEWLNEKDTIELINGFENYANVSSFLYQVNNMESIVNVCRKIESREFKFYDDIRSITDGFIKRLENKEEKGIICYGKAGSGKTVMALKLFFELKNSKMLILNPKLFFSLNMGRYYSQGKATYKTETIKEMVNENDILIVDEAQRLDENQLIDLIGLNVKIILFGDEKQSFGENGNLMSSKELRKYLINKTGFNLHRRDLKKNRRYSNEVAGIIENLTSLEHIETKKRNDFEINLFCANEEEFIKKYEQTKDLKKIYVPYSISQKNGSFINEKYYEMADFKFNYFSVYETLNPNILGHTLHALSFDIDHGFIYLPTIKLVKVNKHNMIFYKEKYDDVEEVTKFMNELNILFSRGRKSLNIYVNDIHVYLFLKARMPK